MQPRELIETTVYQLGPSTAALSDAEILAQWSAGELEDVRELDGGVYVETAWTPAGFDSRWITAINEVLSGRESSVRIADLNHELWDRFLGPLVDAIEDGDYDPADPILAADSPSA